MVVAHNCISGVHTTHGTWPQTKANIHHHFVIQNTIQHCAHTCTHTHTHTHTNTNCTLTHTHSRSHTFTKHYARIDTHTHTHTRTHECTKLDVGTHTSMHATHTNMHKGKGTTKGNGEGTAQVPINRAPVTSGGEVKKREQENATSKGKGKGEKGRGDGTSAHKPGTCHKAAGEVKG